jgi:hypothetical protein
VDVGVVPSISEPRGRLFTAMAGTARRMPFKTWAAERDVNVLCLDRVRFDSVPVTVGQGDLRRMPTSPQMAWEARRKHAPCSVPIPPAWGMDALYLRESGEESYVRRLWKVTTQDPRGSETSVSSTVICLDMPLIPAPWPTSGRKTEDPKKTFSSRGYLHLPGEERARDIKYALYSASLIAEAGDPGRIFGEVRKEYANRRNGMLVNWLHVEFYRIPLALRTSLYPQVPNDWEEWEVHRSMCVPLPAVLAYRGSALIRGDPLHWCIFRTEWVVAVFARFVADAYHRGILWRLPSKVQTSVESLGVEALVVGTSYPVESVRQLIELQTSVDWSAWGQKGYSALPAVPVYWEEAECKVCDLTPFGGQDTGIVSDEEVEEVVARGQVRGNQERPRTPPSPVLEDVYYESGGESRRPSPFVRVPRPRDDHPPLTETTPLPWRSRLSSGPSDTTPGVSQVTTAPVGGGAERRLVVPPETEYQNYTAFAPADVPEGPTALRFSWKEIEEQLRHVDRLADFREYVQVSPLTAVTIGRALGSLLESRAYHRHQAETLKRRLEELEAERLGRLVVDRTTAQSLAVISEELANLSERHARPAGGGLPQDESAGQMAMRKRPRTQREW